MSIPNSDHDTRIRLQRFPPRRLLISSKWWIGETLLATDRADEAMPLFREALALADNLAAREPSRSEWGRSVVMSEWHIALAMRKLRDPEAQAWIERAQQHARAWAERFPNDRLRGALLQSVRGSDAEKR